MDQATLIVQIGGFALMFLERLFYYLSKTRKNSKFKSSCCGATMDVERSSEPIEEPGKK